MSKIVKMIRHSDGKTADVHVDEVENYSKGGFVVDGNAKAEPAGQDGENPLDSMTKKQLLEVAEEFKIEVDARANKADLLDVIKKALEAQAAEPAPVNFASDEAGELAVKLNNEGKLATGELAKIEGTGENGALTVGDIEDHLAKLNA